MIFLIKHRWWLAALVTVLLAPVNWHLGGWDDFAGGPLPIGWQIAGGIGGALVAIIINGVLHEALKRFAGQSYIESFKHYGREILGRMRWGEYLAGGLMAALAEETFFRGVLLRAIDTPLPAIAISAFIFAACHWLRPRYFGFWIWALWEGVLLGGLLLVTGSLLVPMIAHGLHDIAAYRILGSLLGNGDKSH